MRKLSVVISAHNEEKNIEGCLKSVMFADEIIVMDNSSTDNTCEIAKKYTKKIISQKNNPLSIDLLKNTGFEQATGEYILSIDADERVEKSLEDEIKEVLESASPKTGYRIPRENIIFGKWMKHTGWYPDYQLRLFQTGTGKFIQDRVHVGLSVEGGIGTLSNALRHENYTSVSQFIQKMDVYTTSQAQDLARNKTVQPVDAIKMPLHEFLKRFFAEKGYLDGLHGLVLSLLMSFYYLAIFAKVWELQKFADDNSDILPIFEGEFKNARKEIAYWVNHEKKAQSNNPFRKLHILVKGKLE